MRTSTALSATLFLLALTPAAHASGGYRFTTFDHPDAADFTYIFAVNDRGDVGGVYVGADGAFHSYLLRDGVLRSLDVPGATMTLSTDLDDDGVVTGTYGDAQGFQHGFRRRGDDIVTIDFPGAAQTTGFEFEFGTGLGTAAVRSAHGLTIGWYADASAGLHSFLLDHGAFQTIDFPGALVQPTYGTEAITINDRGVIGGTYVLPGSPLSHGYLLEKGVYTTFDVPGAGGEFGTQVECVNNHGWIVGTYTDDDDDIYHGYVFHDGAFVTTDVPGAVFTDIVTINDAGVIGGAFRGPDGITHAYVGTPVR